jgi:hypothetical protein
MKITVVGAALIIAAAIVVVLVVGVLIDSVGKGREPNPSL